ncbi:hypothetical protein ABIE60_002280 [Marinobacterium sp. MBR-109]|jgi:hypothetical protein
MTTFIIVVAFVLMVFAFFGLILMVGSIINAVIRTLFKPRTTDK